MPMDGCDRRSRSVAALSQAAASGTLNKKLAMKKEEKLNVIVLFDKPQNINIHIFFSL